MKTLAVTLVVGAAALGCGAPPDPTPQPEEAVPMEPAAAGELPAVLLGEAPAPTGTHVQYVPDDPDTRGYLAVPAGSGPFPAVILVHEWNGVVDRIRQMADALAAEGYLAFAADLYRGRTGSNRDENMALVRETQADPQAIIDNLNVAAAFLRARSDVTGRIATMGWCFGGGIALSYALGGDQHEGTAIFYGRLVDDPTQLASIQHEVYGTFAAEDGGPSPEQVEGFVDALREAGVPNDVHIYDAVNHGFWLYVERDLEDARPAALDAWERLKAYLERTLRS